MGRADGDPPAFAAERQERILQLLTERGRIRTVELAAELAVAEPTVRKDIIDLAGRGLLRRTYGGALAAAAQSAEPTIAARSSRNVDAKSRIAALALGLIGDGESVYLDNGTTVLALASLLADTPVTERPRQLNVLTNGIEVAQTLADAAGIGLVVLGGSYRTAGKSFTGPLTLLSLQQFSVSTAFIGVSGLRGDELSVADLSEAQVKHEVIQRAGRVVVCMDSSKFGASDFARVASLQDVHVLVTDRLPDDERRLADRRGLRVLTP
ncbi:DeoR/GlpR family DNA-binding transcription regulator [Nakamurella endophytica]|uniref:Lactose phosphotransferase system repressor n=1 Tax=Nakamurella endophytica TaxID=1748367 RepID=A0A917T4N3_9ACTN|nr:DeoR/GlpR family DNA-binding transcription regulator [Nakamurella endophytica]GGM10925.1 DeoR family transcriptional regulator [Nakamurella endophytica]